MELTFNDIADMILEQKRTVPKIIELDFSYLQTSVEDWWLRKAPNKSKHMLKLELISLLLSKIKEADKFYFDKVGKTDIVALTVKNIFSIDNHELALIVHESMSELFHLKDIKYHYESHKALFLKPGGEEYNNWGNGFGDIAPHSDDLYEECDTDYLALTVCRDITSTPTFCYLAQDIISDLNRDEILQILTTPVKFTSGKNVNLIKSRQRHLIVYTLEWGIQYFFDFRIDKDTGQRMQGINHIGTQIIEKLHNKIQKIKPISMPTETGRFSIMANLKVLHARSQLNYDKLLAIKSAEQIDFHTTPRLLYRSKGPHFAIHL